MEYVNTICKSCGKEFSVMKWKFGQGRGKNCSKECRHAWQRKVISGEKSYLWNGGFYYDHNGYKLLRAKEHPFRNAVGYVREHRLVMEKHIGRYLKRTEIVHHINEIKDDNRIENLKLVSSPFEHRQEHKRFPTSCLCGDISMTNGLCCRHYHRLREHGVLDYAPRKRLKRI